MKYSTDRGEVLELKNKDPASKRKATILRARTIWEPHMYPGTFNNGTGSPPFKCVEYKRDRH